MLRVSDTIVSFIVKLKFIKALKMTVTQRRQHLNSSLGWWHFNKRAAQQYSQGSYQMSVIHCLINTEYILEEKYLLSFHGML